MKTALGVLAIALALLFLSACGPYSVGVELEKSKRQYELEMAKLGYAQEIRQVCEDAVSAWGPTEWRCKDALVWVSQNDESRPRICARGSGPVIRYVREVSGEEAPYRGRSNLRDSTTSWSEFRRH